MIYLRKANDDVVSHCSCGDGRVTFPPQMDCPWCGCGWLFTCVTCRKAFTFADAVELDGSWETIAREDLRNGTGDDPSDDEVASWIEAMQDLLADIEAGKRYVILDGAVLPIDATNVEFDGWHAHHQFAELPQAQALDDATALKAQLGKRAYWLANALPESE